MIDNIKCIVCDDERIARDGLTEIISDRLNWLVESEVNDAFKLLHKQKEIDPDVIFLDIHMPGLNGIEVAKKIKSQNPTTEIIFVTAYDQYAIQAFDLFALDYVLKPYNADRITESMMRAEKVVSLKKGFDSKDKFRENDYLQRLFIPSVSKINLIELSDVYGFISNGNYVDVILKNNTTLHRSSMGYLESHLDPETFMRCHRSCIAKLKEIVAVNYTGDNKYELTLSNGIVLKMSATYRSIIMAALEESIWNK